MRYNFDLSPEKWRQHGRGLQERIDSKAVKDGIPVRPRDGIGFISDIQPSLMADPNAGPNWNGYLVTEIPGNMLRGPSAKPNSPAYTALHPGPLLPPVLALDPKSRLVIEYQFDISVDAKLNFESDPGNNYTPTAPGFFPFIKSDTWDMMGSPARWWAKQRFVLQKTANTVVCDVSLDPANWSNVDGTSGELAGQFALTLARPTYMGVTFGGGYYAGHGINVSNGNAAFHMTAFYTY